MSFEHRLATIAEARSLDGSNLQGATQFVDHERGQSFAFDILSDDEERTALLGNLLENRQEVLHVRADLLLVEEDHDVFEDRLHALGIGDEVGREVAAVELHAFDDFQLGFQTLGFFDRDDAVFADLVHGLGDDGADLFVVVGGNGSDVGDLTGALDGNGQLVDSFDGCSNGEFDAALELHRVGASGDVLGALAKDGLCEHSGRGGAVAGDVRGLAEATSRTIWAPMFSRLS